MFFFSLKHFKKRPVERKTVTFRHEVTDTLVFIPDGTNLSERKNLKKCKMATTQLAKHASDVQRQRHWIHGDKYSGYNTSWAEYIRNLEQECVKSMKNMKEGTSAWKTMQRTAKFLDLLIT